jgi:hypothetical protein
MTLWYKQASNETRMLQAVKKRSVDIAGTTSMSDDAHRQMDHIEFLLPYPWKALGLTIIIQFETVFLLRY